MLSKKNYHYLEKRRRSKKTIKISVEVKSDYLETRKGYLRLSKRIYDTNRYTETGLNTQNSLCTQTILHIRELYMCVCVHKHIRPLIWNKFH